jgi:GAF domain-containing protein
MAITIERAGSVDALALTADLAAQSFKTADEGIQAVLATAQRLTGLQTLLLTHISKTDSTLHVIAVRNTDPALTIPEGLQIPLTMSPCRNVAGEDAPFLMADLREDAELAVLPATKDMGACAYIGVPVIRADGTFFGTLAGLNVAPQEDLARHVQWLQILARLAAFQLERKD